MPPTGVRMPSGMNSLGTLWCTTKCSPDRQASRFLAPASAFRFSRHHRGHASSPAAALLLARRSMRRCRRCRRCRRQQICWPLFPASARATAARQPSRSPRAARHDLNYVVLLAVIFPTIVTAFFFKDSIAEAFGPPPPEEIPAGWRKENSQSRPGKFSYVNIKTKERYDRLPNWAGKE